MCPNEVSSLADPSPLRVGDEAANNTLNPTRKQPRFARYLCAGYAERFRRRLITPENRQ